MAVVKKVGIKESGSSSMTVKKVGAEAQNVIISYDSSGHVIEDITQSGAVVTSTKPVTKAFLDIENELDNKATTAQVNAKVPTVNGKVPAQYLPSYTDDIIEGYYNSADGKFYEESTYTTEIAGEVGKIYVDLAEDSMYRWENNTFIEILNATNKALVSLTNVNVSNPQDGEALTYDAASGKWINKNVTSHIVHIPTIVVGTYTYNGQPQGPTLTNLDSDFYDYVTVTGISATDAGSYTVTLSLKNTFTSCWSDLTTTNKTQNWSIGKATGSLTLASNSVTLDDSHKVVNVGFSRLGTGTVSASSSNTGIAMVAVSGSNIVITATEETGSATITVSVAADGNYTAASNKTISVTANFARLVSWSTGTDEEITKMVNAYYSGSFTLDQIKSVWHVGDERSVSLSAMSSGDITNTEVSGVTNTLTAEAHRAQTVKIVILDFDHDILTTSAGGKTKALVTLGQKDCLRDATVSDTNGQNNTENGKMNNDVTNNGGWKGCPRRTWCNNNYYNALPSYLKTLVKPVNKLSGIGNGSSSGTETTSDKCWLMAEYEIFGSKSYSVDGEGTQYSYYTTASNRYKLPKWSASSVSGIWWERSPALGNSSNFCRVDRSGYANSSGAGSAYGLAPACCL